MATPIPHKGIASASASCVAPAIASYLRFVGKRTRYHFCLGDRLASAEAIFAPLQAALTDGPALIPIWNCNSLLLLAVFASNPLFQRLATAFSIVADDSIGGTVTVALTDTLGLRSRIVRRISPADRIRDIKSMVAAQPRIVIAVDSHGPYQHVGQATGRLVKTLRPSVLPLAASSSRNTLLFKTRQINMALPLPGGEGVVSIAPVPSSTADKSIAQICAAIEEALFFLQSTADDALQKRQ